LEPCRLPTPEVTRSSDMDGDRRRGEEQSRRLRRNTSSSAHIRPICVRPTLAAGQQPARGRKRRHQQAHRREFERMATRGLSNPTPQLIGAGYFGGGKRSHRNTEKHWRHPARLTCRFSTPRNPRRAGRMARVGMRGPGMASLLRGHSASGRLHMPYATALPQLPRPARRRSARFSPLWQVAHRRYETGSRRAPAHGCAGRNGSCG
jgi:hypothetical protein